MSRVDSLSSVNKLIGKVFLVGAGPGAADLLTVRAVRLLERAEVILHDALVSAEILALAPQATCIAVGKRCGRHSAAQPEINQQLIAAAQQHRIVVRLKGGDPTLFGRANEEIEALEAAGIRYEIVPGITAALAAAASLGVSLTQRGVARAVTFATPRTGNDEAAAIPNDWLAQAAAAETLVLYMGAGQAAGITRTLLAAGKPASWPIAIVENASLPAEQVLRGTLADLPDLALAIGAGPAILLFGDAIDQTHRRAGPRHVVRESALI